MTNSAKYAYYAPSLLEHARHVRQPRRLRALRYRRAASSATTRLWQIDDRRPRDRAGRRPRARRSSPTEPLSFWGGYDFKTGEIIDKHHPLAGVRAAGRILAVPFSKGSSTTTAVLLEAVRAGTAPAAILTTGVDSFFALASIVADVMYGRSFPVVVARGSRTPRASRAHARRGSTRRIDRDPERLEPSSRAPHRS